MINKNSVLKETMKTTDIVREIEQEAWEKGEAMGIEQGEHIKAVQIAEKLFKKAASVSDVVELTGLSEKAKKEAEEIRQTIT